MSTFLDDCYLVGGSVRDEILGGTPSDYDYATPMLPDDIEQAVRDLGRRPVLVGKRFGTVGFKWEGDWVEVTTFRSEIYGKTRKPEVEFVSTISEDLSRRDFTINAIAKRKGKYIDPFGGREDIQNGIIRAVGNPTMRFKEDPLRMLRACRFVSQLGFTIEPDTLKSMQKHANRILSVSKERWVQELDKLLIGDNVADGLESLRESGLLKFIFPELQIQVGYNQNSPHHGLELWEHTKGVVELADKPLRWAALLHDVAKPFTRTDKPDRSNYIFHDVIGADMVYGIGKRLKWSNERIQEVSDLVRYHLLEDSPLRKADKGAR
jgi:putative nucleotidyltransferase with HDIG domain